MSGAIVPIRRADRLFDILRILRSAKAPVTAASIADELEVTVRTVYRHRQPTSVCRDDRRGHAWSGGAVRSLAGWIDMDGELFDPDLPVEISHRLDAFAVDRQRDDQEVLTAEPCLWPVEGGRLLAAWDAPRHPYVQQRRPAPEGASA
jgi:predicted DNA-binding transcriptional regulator YafY